MAHTLSKIFMDHLLFRLLIPSPQTSLQGCTIPQPCDHIKGRHQPPRPSRSCPCAGEVARERTSQLRWRSRQPQSGLVPVGGRQRSSSLSESCLPHRDVLGDRGGDCNTTTQHARVRQHAPPTEPRSSAGRHHSAAGGYLRPHAPTQRQFGSHGHASFGTVSGS